MDRYASGRREFLKTLSALGVAGLPFSMPHSAPRRRLERAVPAYDPAAKFEIAVRDVEFRRNKAGRTALPRNPWTAPSPGAACSSSPST
jgi:hypothetical protein